VPAVGDLVLDLLGGVLAFEVGHLPVDDDPLLPADLFDAQDAAGERLRGARTCFEITQIFEKSQGPLVFLGLLGRDGRLHLPP
jgi:hypothetical protein